MTVKAFSDLFPFDRFQALVASLAHAGNDSYDTALATLVTPALKGVLEDRLSRGELRPVPNSNGHETRFLSAWNALVSGRHPGDRSEEDLDEVIDFLAHSAVGRWAFYCDKEGEPQALLDQQRKFYGKLAESLDGGNIRFIDLQNQRCGITGETYWVQFGGWNPTFVKWTPGNDAVPMEPGEPASVKEFEVTFPTGELLVADWFRVDGFSEVVDAIAPELGSERGKEEAARRYAEMGLVSVHVWNTSPRIFERDGVLVFGQGEGRSLGSVCTDYWGTSVIDRARLVEIVSATLGREDAEQAVEALTNEHTVSRISVEPGTYWLYMTGEKEHFGGLFAPDDVDLDGVEPYFALSPRRLSYEPGASLPKP